LSIGANIRQLRKDRHLTQKELAKLAEVPQSTLCQIEKGTTSIGRHDTISKIFGALKVPVKKLHDDTVQ